MFYPCAFEGTPLAEHMLGVLISQTSKSFIKIYVLFFYAHFYTVGLSYTPHVWQLFGGI